MINSKFRANHLIVVGLVLSSIPLVLDPLVILCGYGHSMFRTWTSLFYLFSIILMPLFLILDITLVLNNGLKKNASD
jgi:hypothetical protein